jgi:hypothetical protein
MEILRHASLFALLSLILTLTPLVMAVAYVVRPTERRLALMRPLSLAGLFAAMTGCVLGFINVLRSVGVERELSPAMAIGAAESLVTLFVGFASLTAAWLLVAAGMSRHAD